MPFSYPPGSRPIEPYTIKHALGSGGFGEVYYAVSDSGKEVALKCLRRDCDVELRGIRACLNLAHPHLVAVHDLRQATDGTWWLIMEYVAGPTWSALLREHPNGLALPQVCAWFCQLADAVDFLHQHGVVHRDLKPSNIFLMDSVPGGWVKLGDYGLSKVMSGQSADTHTQLGTVYYMAPEMTQGKYGAAVDIYAAGVILYQMLTGRLPFAGQSVQEILLRHLTDEPDWTKLPPAAVAVLRQALAKDPATRFTSLQEMAQQLERSIAGSGAAHVSVGSLRTAAEVSQAAATRVSLRRGPRSGSHEPSTVVYRPPNRLYELARSWTLSALGAVVVAMFIGVIGSNLRPQTPWSDYALLGAFAWVTSWSLLAVQRLWWDYHWPEVWARCLVRIVLGMSLGLVSAWLDGAGSLWPPTNLPESWVFRQAYPFTFLHQGLRCAAFFGLLFLLVPWEHLMRLSRPWRFDWNPVLLIVLLAGGLIWLWQLREVIRWEQEYHKVFNAGLTAMLIQWASPHQRTASGAYVTPQQSS
ncbi:MAG: serine/threonine-protein kinase [Gemmatales bacterium]|nr:serine/threonine protein kinase [Gemmatales bacterium]MDW7994813.1 serine/threonine-protein kinase [Gemmatales bacterium]